MRKSTALAFAGALAGLVACSSLYERGTQQVYDPLFDQGSAPRSPSARGTLEGDFAWAIRSTTLAEAATRWDEFLRAHRPADGEYEDGFAAMHVRAAELELLRVQYLLGRRAEGDALMRSLDLLGIDGGAVP